MGSNRARPTRSFPAAAFAAFAAFAALAGCAGRDVDKLCPIAEAVNREASIAPADKHDEFVKRASSEVSSSAAKNILAAVSAVEPAKRSLVMKQGAKEVGRDDWTCPAYDAIAVPSN